MNLEHLHIFLRIVELGSLAATARAEGLSSTTVSERLAALEDYYGARLINRTTRALSLTEAGQVLVEGIPNLLDQEQTLAKRIRSGMTSLEGMIRISAPVDLGNQRIAPVLDDFLEKHTKVRGELILKDDYTDLVAERVDIAVRYGVLPDSALMVRRIDTRQRVVCASPEYIKTHDLIETPDDLINHNCLCMKFGHMLDESWTFSKGNQTTTIKIQGNRLANDGSLVRRWCLQGKGIALKSIWDVEEDLKAGRLVALLPEYIAPNATLQLVFPSVDRQPKRVQTFANCLIEALNTHKHIDTN